MKITDVKADLVVHPLPGEFHPTWGPGLVQEELPLTLIKLETNEGVTGYGALPANDKEGIVGVNTFIREELIGEDVFNTEGISKVLRNASLRMTWPWGIEMAVWDAIGKKVSLPVYKLWGGYQDEIRIYASLGEVKGIEERLEDIYRIKEEGFAGIKLRFHEDFEKDLEISKEVCKVVGDDMTLMADANQADVLPGSDNYNQWDYQTAYRVGEKLEELEFSWLEEPLPRFDFEGLKKLNNKLTLPIAGGEKNQMMHEYKQLIENDCYDIIQGDASFSEGLFQLRKIAGLAEAHHKRFIPHTWCNGLSLFANLQLAASLPNCPWFEYPFEVPGWTHEANTFLFKHDIKIEDGHVKVPERPGLGFELDENKVDEYTVTS